MNGMMTIEKTDEKTTAVFVDQDTLECARLNMRTKKRLQNAEMLKRNKARYNKRMKTIRNRIITNAGIGAAVTIGGAMGLIHPFLAVPVAIGFICMACVGLGAYLGVKK